MILDVRTRIGGGLDEMDAIFPYLFDKETVLVGMDTGSDVNSPLDDGRRIRVWRHPRAWSGACVSSSRRLDRRWPKPKFSFGSRRSTHAWATTSPGCGESSPGFRSEGVPLQRRRGFRTLAEFFDGRSQLLIYHFMFGPSYAAGCPTCSSSADAVNAVLPHLHARDVTMLYVSRAPVESLLTYRERMGWSFPWVSCATNDFNFDMGFSYTDEQVNEFAGPLLEAGAPPILDADAAAWAPMSPAT